jgi:pimeloyl-ACP methyl ester carboxylesterase
MSVETEFIDGASADSAGPRCDTSLPAPAAPALVSEGCPTPLGWAEVLESFRSEGAAWSIDVDGGTLHGRTLGRGRPLYFLNGITGNCELFCLLAWLLRDDFRCVLFDYRSLASLGRRRDVARAGRLTMRRLVDDLWAVADAQGERTFSLFAAPFGALVALSAMSERPERVEQAVLLGGFVRRRLSLFERFLCGVGRFVPGKSGQVPVRDTLQRASHQRAFPPFDASRWGFFAANTSQTPIGDLADRAALLGTFDLTRDASRIERPVLLLGVEHEGAISAAGREELQRLVPAARTEFIPLAGQLAYLTHPHRVAKAVRSFLVGTSSEPEAPGAALGLDNSCGAGHKDESP